ncbi:uncharacterized protein LOC124285359 isoform X2 [Haliotis rubra]|uniref:uncharacterized protein LOC124285359 isoform X2 n=1 Tax=Haliotis rubra TaxID=36100 RepID=UPI001EE56695|nr:uncharacterized protein LOC124285359 isoform X2 [Haliotis rubra]
MTKCVLYLFACVAVATAHVCMISPPQRGSMLGINKMGAVDCMLVAGPCGKRAVGPAVALTGGQNFTVTFQKNLDHWVKATPGYFSIMWGLETMPLKELVRIPDMGQPSLSLFSVNVTIPTRPGKGYILQTQYMTNNPKAPPTFYQCGDIIVM